MKIEHQVYRDLKSLGLVHDESLELYADRTRDKEIRVFRDRNSGVVLLEQVVIDQEYYAGKKRTSYRQQDQACTTNRGSTIVSAAIDDDDNNRRFAQFESLIQGARLCDFGAGAGAFAGLCLDIASEVYAVEPERDSASAIEQQFGQRIRVAAQLDELPGRFEVITAFHVLEHLEYQLDTLREFHERLEGVADHTL